MNRVQQLRRVLVLTAAFAMVELAGGLVSGSLALLADAGHMVTDVLALVLAYQGARVAARRVSAADAFGNRRWEVLAAMVNGVLLFVIAIGIAVEAWHRVEHPHLINADLFGGIALAGLVVNLVALRVLHGHHHHDLNVRGAYLHIMGDLLGSVGAIVAAVVIEFSGWTMVDPLVSVLISLVLLASAARLIRDSAEILLDKVPRHVSPEALEAAMVGVAGVDRVHDLHVWSVTEGLVAMSAHIVVQDLDAHPRVRRELEAVLRHRGMRHLTLQLETGDPCVGEGCGHHDEAHDPDLHHGHQHAHPHA